MYLSNEESLLQLTKELVTYLDQIEAKFQSVKESGEKSDFFAVVKPFADEVKEVNDRWRDSAIDWIDVERPKNIFEKQIQSTYEQIEMLSVQAFFPDTSRTRFVNYLQSVRFILNTVMDRL